MLTTILWDNDGVLVDTEHLYFRACREVLARVDIELSEERYIDLFLKKNEGLFSMTSEYSLSHDEAEGLRHWRDARYTELLGQGITVLDGVHEVLEALHGRVRMGIVTGSRRRHFEAIHARTELLPYFDFVLVREDYRESKPDPAPYLEAMQRHGLHAAECLVVEDSDRGLRAALAAGVRCAVIPQGLTHGLDFSGAFRILESISDLLGLVDELSHSPTPPPRCPGFADH
jgi:HAD superfamily hydrolase (TIGR01509 family)